MDAPRDKSFKFDWQRKILACRLGKNTTAVALALSVHTDKFGTNAHPGIRLLAHEAEVSERMARAALERLRELGLIVRTMRGSTAQHRNWADVYELALPDDLHERVVVEEKPSDGECKGQGGMANHVRWHERRGITDPKCAHCAEQQEETLCEGFPEGFGEESSRGLAGVRGSLGGSPRENVDPIRPPAKRSPTTGKTDGDHWSVRTPQHVFNTTPSSQHAASPVAGPRASSRADDETYKTFVAEQLAARIQPDEDLTEEDEEQLFFEIDYNYVVHIVGELDVVEESTVLGMLQNSHACAAVNAVRAMRGRAA
jgi:hypothetical protein